MTTINYSHGLRCVSADRNRVINIDEFEDLCRRSGEKNEFNLQRKIVDMDVYEDLPNDKPVKLYADFDFKEKHINDPDDDDESYEAGVNDGYDENNTVYAVEVLEREITNYLTETFSIDTPPNFAAKTATQRYLGDRKNKMWANSAHIIITNFAMSVLDQKTFWGDFRKWFDPRNEELFKKLNTKPNFAVVDENPYMTNQRIRCVYSSKPYEKRPFRLLKGTFKDTLISVIPEDCHILELQNKQIQEPVNISLERPPVQRIEDIENSNNFQFINEALNRGLLRKEADRRIDWLKFGFAIKNTFGDDGEDLFINFSKLSERWESKTRTGEWSEDDIRNQYKNFDLSHKNPVSMGTIKRWIRDENPAINSQIIEHFKSIKQQEKEQMKNVLMESIPENCFIEPILDENDLTRHIIPLEELEGCGDYDIAVAIKKCFGTNFKCVSIERNLWYYFENYSWKTTEVGTALRNIISTDFAVIVRKRKAVLKNIVNQIDPMDIAHNRITTKINRLETILQRLSKTNDKKNIMTELKEILYDEDFEKGFNTAKNVLPIKGGLLFDMITCKSRYRTVDDKFNYECPVSYKFDYEYPVSYKIDYKCLIDEYEEIDTYFNQIFCGDLLTKRAFLNCIKTTFSGTILRHLFICSGDGSNGKSLLFKLLNTMFGRAMDTISEKVVIITKTQSNLNTEMEKLDKIRLAFLSELPLGAKLNETIIKKITGGDSINLRTLNTKDFTITPTATIWQLCNEEPEFKTEKAMMTRIVNFPFNANFETNVNFETKMLTKLDAVFSYIMVNGVITHSINPSPAMLEKKRQYVADQSNPLLEYITANIDRDISKKSERNKWCIKRDEFIQSYYSWCSLHHKRDYEIGTKSTFTKQLTKMGISNKESNSIVWFENIQYKPYEIEDHNNDDCEQETIEQ